MVCATTTKRSVAMRLAILLFSLKRSYNFPRFSKLSMKLEPCHVMGETGTCRWLDECPDETDPNVAPYLRKSASCNSFSSQPLVCCVDKDEDSIGVSQPLIATNSPRNVIYDTSNPDVRMRCGKDPCKLRHVQPALPFYSVKGNEERVYCGLVTGGWDAAPSNWPWMALLGYDTHKGLKWLCGGTLINDEWVITAAHCFDKSLPVIVRLGEFDYDRGTDGVSPEDFGVAEIVVHPEYSNPVAYHDIALIKLHRPVKFSRMISPVCLPWNEELGAKIVGRKVALAGWGAKKFGGKLSPVLQETFLTIFDSQVCDTSYRSLYFYDQVFPEGIKKENFVCAGHVDGGKDACSGDSGAPLVYSSIDHGIVLTGIVSKGNGCGLKEFPGLYVPIHRPDYLTWIKITAF